MVSEPVTGSDPTGAGSVVRIADPPTGIDLRPADADAAEVL